MFDCFPKEGLLKPIFENAQQPRISPEVLDGKLVAGWRHFGTRFFRCNFAIHEGRLCGVLPLRIRVGDFEMSKSQRRIWRGGAEFDTKVLPAIVTDEHHDLFERHKARFSDNVPDSLFDFIDPAPARIPCETRCVEIRTADGGLVAVSFFDVGADSLSSVYAMFDAAFADSSPGILTILHELATARELGKRYHYLGYSYTIPSPYDYKRRFASLEAYEWNSGWKPFPRGLEWSRELDEPRRAV
ncbi:MAG: GNAT family N-acetyltransferase [Chthoniobacterales bacterium]